MKEKTCEHCGEKVCDKCHPDKFSLVKALKGTLLNRFFICFGAWAALAFFTMTNGGSDEIKTIKLIVFAVVCVVWMLADAFKELIRNGKLNINAGANLGRNKNINKTMEA